MTRQVPRIKVRYPTKATNLLIKIDVVNNDTGSCHIQLPDYVVGGELSSIVFSFIRFIPFIPWPISDGQHPSPVLLTDQSFKPAREDQGPRKPTHLKEINWNYEFAVVLLLLPKFSITPSIQSPTYARIPLCERAYHAPGL